MYDSGQSLLTIINDILDLSRMEAGALELDCVDFDLRPRSERASPWSSRERAQRASRQSSTWPPTYRRCCAAIPDVSVRSVELLGNAVKFTSAGEVRLAARVIADQATGCSLGLTVRDTGMGIPRSTFMTVSSRPTRRQIRPCPDCMAAVAWVSASAAAWSP